MTFQVLAQADRSRILLLPQSGSKVLFEGYLRLKDMPQGPRVFKFLVKKGDEAEKFLPPEDALRMLRKASAIYLARGDSAMENKFIELHFDRGHSGIGRAKPSVMCPGTPKSRTRDLR